MAGSLDLGSLILRVTCNTSEAVNGLNNVADKATSATSNIQKLSQVGSSLTSLGRTLTATLTVPIVALSTAAINMGMDFEQAMAQVQATAGIASNTSAEFQALEAAAREVGRTTQLSATESANALYYMALAGWDTQEMLDGLTPIANLSIATMTDLATTSDIVTDSFSAFGYETDQLIDGIPAVQHYVDVLAQTVRNSNTDVIQLGEAFKYVAPLCGTLGYTVEDVAIALGLMANNGIKASTAGTTLRSALTNLANPTDQMKEAMNDLGLSLSNNGESAMSFKELMDKMREAFKDLSVTCTDSSGNLLEYDSLLQAVAENGGNAVDSITGLTQVQKIEAASTIFGKRAMSGMLAVLTATDETYQELTNSIYNANGATQEMVDIMMSTGKGSLERIKSALEDIGISLYQNVEVALKDVLLKVEQFAQGLADLMAADEEFTKRFIQVAAAIAAIGPALIIVGTGMKTVAALTAATNSVLAALGVTATLTITGFLALASTLVGVAVGIKKNVGGVLDKIRDSLAVIESALYRNKDTWETVFSIISSMCNSFYKNVITPIFSAIGEVVLFAGEVFSSFYNSVSDAMLPIMYLIQKAYFNVIEPVFSGIVQKARDVIGVFRTKFPEIQKTIENVCTTVGGFLRDVLGGALDEIIKIFEELKPLTDGVWNAVLDIISGAIQGICDFINNLLLPMLKAFTRFMEIYILPIVKKVWEGVKDVIQGNGGKISSFITEKLLPAFQSFSDFMNFEVYPIVYETWTKILDTIGSATITITIWVEEKLIPVLENMGRFMNETVWPAVKQAWDYIKQVVQISIDVLKSLIDSVLIPAFKSIVDVFKEHVVPLFQTAWENLKIVIQVSIDFIKSLIDNVLLPVFKTIADVCKDYVWPIVKWVWDSMMAGIGIACDIIKGLIDNILVPAFKGIADFCTNFLFPAFNEVWTFITDIVRLAIDTIVDLWNSSLKPCWDSLCEFLNVTLVPIFKGAWEAIKWVVSTVSDWINSKMDSVRKIMDFLGLDVNTTKGAFDNAFNAIKFIVELVAGSIKAAIDSVTNVLKALTSTVQWVKDAISPVLNGIGGMFSSVFGAASRAVGWVIDKCKSLWNWIGDLADKASSFSLGGLLGFAEGTNSAPQGKAWVAEAGPEMIVDRQGRASIAALPQIYDFKGGEQVLTNSQTTDLLSKLKATRRILGENLNTPQMALAGPRTGSNDISSINSLLLEMIASMKGIELNNNTILDGKLLARTLVKPFEQELNRVQRNRSFAKGGNLVG